MEDRTHRKLTDEDIGRIADTSNLQFRGLQAYGFIILTDHNVGTDLLDRASALGHALLDRDWSGTVRRVDARHRLEKLAEYSSIEFG